MTLAIAWLLFPLLLGLLCLGCGLLLERAAGIELPAPLLLPAGFALLSLTAQFATLSDSTAELATPAVLSLAVAGLGLSFPGRLRGRGTWWIGSAAGVFAVFAAPTVLSGRATFSGYIKLDDTATYLAMLDRAIHHGYDVAGLAPSTYEATLKTSLVLGYPLGSLLPLGVGRTLVAQDAAWLWQPYLSFLAALLALGLYQLVSGLVRSSPLRALVAFVGAQAALLFGYALWGGIKELATAAAVVLAAALVPVTMQALGRPRAVLPLAAAAAAVVGILSLGGAAWLAPVLAGALLHGLRSGGLTRTLRSSAALVVAASALAIPSFVAGKTWLTHSGGFTSGSEYANLVQRLSWLQAFGIWPNGDFRTRPESLDVTRVLVAVVGLSVVLALALSWRRRAWGLPVAVATAGLACLVYVGLGSPWVGAKALASASPIVLAAALAAGAALFELGRRVEGAIVAGVVAVGVLWSNVLQYHEAFLAPSGRLAELASIGSRFAGQGPTLMTEFESYGARHFLRNMDTEGASELRRSLVSLRSGGVAATGVTPDVDEIELASVLAYRTLVLRASPVASRPPSVYSLAWSRRHYQVWQRPEGTSPILEHLSLGSRYQPASVPSCGEIVRLGRLAAADGGVLAAVLRPPAIVIEPDGTRGPPSTLGAYGQDPDVLYLRAARTIDARFSTPGGGRYGIWAGGSFRARLEASVDGNPVGSARDQLNWPGNFTRLGETPLAAGGHVLSLRYAGPDLAPGSGGTPPFGLGPFVVAEGTEDRSVTRVLPARARSLCGKSLDWVEALRG